jgi:phosphatidylglycerophosphate synthase
LLVGGGGALVLVLAARHLRAGATFGAANAVTLARGALVLLLGALLWEDPGTGLGWAVVGLATVAAVLDAVDGKLARGRGETSGFGARFDMETDALFILVLSALVWQHGKAGAWILAAGLLRYGFVAAGRVFIALAAPLPPSRRRQTVCVLQIVSLISALAPIFVPPVSSGLALLGLGVLVWSFGVDVVWLTRRARG